MEISKDELVEKIEFTRKKLNESIDQAEEYKSIYQYSTELDKLIELYIVSGY